MYAMYVATLRLELQIPGSRSLKDKRQVVSRLLHRLRARFPASVAEIGEQQRWQRAEIGVAVVSGDRGLAERLIDQIRRHVEDEPNALVCGAEAQVYAA